MKIFFVLILLCQAVNASENSDGFLAFRGGLSDGSTLYQSVSSSIAGPTGEVTLGWKPAGFLKVGLFDLIESLSLRNNSSTLGTLTVNELGMSARIFFLPKIFIEGGGGVIQANIDNPSTQMSVAAAGSFYYGGSGFELSFNQDWSSELAIRYRNAVFPKNEFQGMTSLFYTLGFNIYF